MSANEPTPSTRPRWLPPILLIAAFMLVVIMSNHSRDTRTPEGLYVVGDDASYEKNLEVAKQLSTEALQDYQEGKKLTQDQVDKIRQAARAIDEANLYRPDKIGPYFLSGKAHAAIGDYEKADEKLKQGLLNAANDHSQAVLMAAIDAHYERSRVLFALGKFTESYNEATIAATAIPNAPDYLVQRAKAALQVNKNDVAQDEITAALAIDPDNPAAKMMRKYLNLPTPPSKTPGPGK